MVLSCGDNTEGCLGHGNTISLLIPKIVHKLTNMRIVQIACGEHHVVALSDEGDLFTWGTSNEGALGLGKHMLSSSEPRRLIVSQMIQNIRQISCGPDCTVVLTDGGFCYCCGSNGFNKLGFGAKLSQLHGLQKVSFITQKVLAVSVAETFAAFLIEGGYVVTAGDNSSGQLGLGHTNEQLEPTLLKSLMPRFVTVCMED